MSYPKKTLKLRPIKGLAIDPPANEVDLEHYTNGSNVIFRQGFAQRILGSRSAYSPPVDVYHLLNFRIETVNFWLVFGLDEIHALETSNVDDVTPVAGLSPITFSWMWSSTILNGVAVATNGLDAPLYWPGTVLDPLEDLPDWPAGTVCKSIVAFQFHLFALDIDGPSGHFESQVKWSDAAEPGAVPASWTPAADTEAGDAMLGDTPGPILCAVPLRGTLMIYKRSAIYACDYIGGNDVFTFRQIFSAMGALTRHAVADLSDGRHLVVSDGDVVLHDGTNRVSAAQGRMKEYLFGALDQDNYENLFVIYHRAKNEVEICFPTTGNTYCNQAIVYDVANDAFGIRALPDVTCAAIGIVNDTAPDETWDADAQAWDADTSTWNAVSFSLAVESLVLGYSNVMEQQDTDDQVNVAASVGRYDLHFGQPERVKFVKRTHVRTKPGFGTLYVRVGARMTPTDSITWSTEQALVEPEQIVNSFAQGRYISVEARSQDDDVWMLSGIDLEAEVRGYR